MKFQTTGRKFVVQINSHVQYHATQITPRVSLQLYKGWKIKQKYINTSIFCIAKWQENCNYKHVIIKSPWSFQKISCFKRKGVQQKLPSLNANANTTEACIHTDIWYTTTSIYKLRLWNDGYNISMPFFKSRYSYNQHEKEISI